MHTGFGLMLSFIVGSAFLLVCVAYPMVFVFSLLATAVAMMLTIK